VNVWIWLSKNEKVLISQWKAHQQIKSNLEKQRLGLFEEL
jgi:hypothetical protein